MGKRLLAKARSFLDWKYFMHPTHWLCASALLLMLTTFASATTSYKVTDIGVGSAMAINKYGQVTGTLSVSGDAYRQVFRYDSRNGSLEYGRLPGSANSIGNAINDAGVIVGQGAPYLTALIWDSAGLRALSVPGTLPYKYAFGINNAGYIVAQNDDYYGNPSNTYVGKDGTWTQVSALPGYPNMIPNDINNSNMVVGNARLGPWNDSASPYAAWIWDGTATPVILPGLAGSTCTAPSALNDNGWVAGYSEDASGNNHAILWSNGGFVDLGTLGGQQAQASGINLAGDVVGLSQTSDSEWHAFLYSNGAMHDLNSLISPDSGWTIVGAHDINDDGLIAGYGVNGSGDVHALLLTPSPVPVPGAVWLLVPSLGAIAAVKKKLQK